MKKYIGFLSLATMLCLVSCGVEGKKDKSISAIPEKTDSTTEDKEIDKAEVVVAETIEAHGGDRYDTAHYSFVFRKKNYSFHNENGNYTYTVTSQKDGREIRDVLKTGKLTRTVNGAATELSQKDVAKYTEALNSVIYFATLPYKLQDPAVNKTYEGQTTIKDQDYDILAVTFAQEGGGVDYEDEFRYWINTDTKMVDYLAYNYETNDGGVRFRSANNPRTVGGIRFQDYINFEAPIGSALNELPELYEAGKLKELSRIATEDVVLIED